ncbi:hypothetical protein sm9_1973 [Methanobrevibacter millerae]|uniref:Uncharacterized protein n=1 Tax=Methanobrevibacter millerae TaxID=230361 RepID=A0A0U3DTK0_9EURY|nr:hypothetical protein sm9_1973 [Methanobrevibacter millerae]
MSNQKIITLNSILDVKQYIFCVSDDGFVLSDYRFVKLMNSCQKVFKSFYLSFKKDVLYFKMSLARCLHCGSYYVVKYGFTDRKLVFKEIIRTHIKVQCYNCNVVVKPFKLI